VTGIHGTPRVEEVELTDLDSGATSRVACDTVVFTGDWIPDYELAAALGLELDPGTRGPRVDTGLRTARRGVFAAGNLLHGAEPADVAALRGARRVRRRLARASKWPERCPARVRRAARLGRTSAVADTTPPSRGRFLLRSSSFLSRPRLAIHQDGRLLWSGRARRLVPGRSKLIPADWLKEVDRDGGRLTVTTVAN
jgi:hypothetical protein